VIVAHATGFSWDEALLVLAPVAVLALLVWLANRRAGRLADDATDVEAEAGTDRAGRRETSDETGADGATPDEPGSERPATGP
jgi:hypothetical protein